MDAMARVKDFERRNLIYADQIDEAVRRGMTGFDSDRLLKSRTKKP